MPLIDDAITSAGALVSVRVGVSENRRKKLTNAGFPVPAEIRLLLQLDTGSDLTGFPTEVFKALQTKPFDEIPISTPSTKPGEACMTFQYDVSIALDAPDGTRIFPSVHAIASDDFQGSVKGILGRDVLDHCHFIFDGPGKTFRLTF